MGNIHDQRRIALPIHDRTNPPTAMIDANDPDGAAINTPTFDRLADATATILPERGRTPQCPATR